MGGFVVKKRDRKGGREEKEEEGRKRKIRKAKGEKGR